MDEKQPWHAGAGSSALSQSRRSPPISSRTLLISGILACFALLQLARSSAWGASFDNSTHFHYQQHEDQLTTYPGEHISWARCGSLPNGRPLECSSIDVPMDQFNAENSGNKTFSIPLIRERGQSADAKNLLLNPGGPGASGVWYIYRKGEQLRDIVGEGFHLVGFDPRGVNGSRPLASCYPDVETHRRLATPVRDAKPVEDSADVYAWTQNFVRACADNMGEYGRYLNTPQMAADMNSILAAVGQAGDLVYWGFSYGTTLGQTYAGLFPESATRVIIDGVENQHDWYAGLNTFESLADTEIVFDGFFDECIKAGPENCTLASLVESGFELREKVLAFASGLQEQPLGVYIDSSSYGTLDYRNIMYDAIFPALLKPYLWYDLADHLAKLLQGDATDAFLAYGMGEEPEELVGDADSFVQFNDGLTGPEHWPQDRKAILDMVQSFFNSTIFGATQNPEYYKKQQWLIPTTHNYVPKTGVKTAHPLLILSTTYDPVCRKLSRHTYLSTWPAHILPSKTRLFPSMNFNI